MYGCIYLGSEWGQGQNWGQNFVLIPTQVGERIHDTSLKEKFIMVVNTTTKVRYERVDWDELYSTDRNEDNKSCHDVINSIPDKHITTITHLYPRAICGRHVGGHGHADIGGKFPRKYEEQKHSRLFNHQWGMVMMVTGA